MITIEELKNNGADVETGLACCAKNEALYLKLINMGLGDQKFEELGTALQENNLDHAFELCHVFRNYFNSQ